MSCRHRRPLRSAPPRRRRSHEPRPAPAYRGLVLPPELALVFDGRVWEEPTPLLRVTATDTTRPLGHFVALHPGALVAAPSMPEEVVWGFFEAAGQPFVLAYEGRGFTGLNVTECINCLDPQATEWADDPTTGERTGIVRYAFHPQRFVWSSVFKIPETAEHEVLVVERRRTVEEEFKRFVEKRRLRGLLFDEIWSAS